MKIQARQGDPGDKIACGQKSESESATPALGSLGLLSLGAAGLVAWRKRRRAQDAGQ